MRHQHDAVYRSICANPDEDTPRLVFADLIEEEGDSSPYSEAGALRAAFIRTQIALALVPEFDPLSVSTRQLFPETLSGCAMMHTFPRLQMSGGYDWGKYEFRRGFPWKASVRSLDTLIETGAKLFEIAPIQALTIDARGRPKMKLLAEWPELSRMRRLEFSLGRFGADELARLGNSPHAGSLCEIAFAFDGITSEGLESLVRSSLFPRLKSLDLHSSVIPPALLVDALGAARQIGSLSRLSLRANQLHRIDSPHLFALPLMRGLQYLDLSENPNLGVAGTRALVESGLLDGVTVLNLGRTRPGVPGVCALFESSALASVHSLDLSANRLGPVAIKRIAESAAAKNLRVLNLAENPVLDAGAIALASSPVLSGLLELDLADCEVSDVGARALADSPYLGGLLRLNLTSRTIMHGGKTRRALVERFGQRVSC